MGGAFFSFQLTHPASTRKMKRVAHFPFRSFLSDGGARKFEIEVRMAAYLLIVFAVLTRLIPHPDWMNFTAVGGALLYFGARRSWREMLGPVAALIATDYVLTVFTYHYAFHWQAYVTTWAWYLAVMALGQILLRARTTFLRVAAGVILGPTMFWIISDYAVWAVKGGMYPHTLAGLQACYIAALPFYRNDLISTALVGGLAFGVPVLVQRMHRTAAVQPAA
jgi:hypothetical protein